VRDATDVRRLGTLMGPRASVMAGRLVTYNDRVTPVQLGDHVLTRVWFRKRKGRVVYVPGVSAVNTNMEYNGLCWVGIRLEDGGFVSTVVDPTGAFLRHKEVLVQRDPDGCPTLAVDEDPHAEGAGTTGFTP
jgi:hypothetical protein